MIHRSLTAILLALATQGFSPAAIAQDVDPMIDARAIYKGRPYSPYADRAFPTDVYFGDTHVHTALSAMRAAAAPGSCRATPTGSRAVNR